LPDRLTRQMYNAELGRLFDLLDGPNDAHALERETVQARRAQRTAEAESRALKLQLADRDAELARLRASVRS